jgi:hypothetical protein
MRTRFTPEAAQVEDSLPDKVYDRLWDALERILADPEEAPYTGWAHYSSAHRVYGTPLPGTDWSVFWRISGDILEVVWILEDAAL